MARPATIDDADILRAARELFLARGIQATTAEIAARAGISEGIIFHRFGSKAQLYEAAMVPPDKGAVLSALALEDRAGKGDLFTQMCEIGDKLIDCMRQGMPIVMMRWSQRQEDPLREMLNSADPAPLRGLRALAGYFEAEMHAGRLRRTDPEILARAFEGGLQEYVFGEIMGQGQWLPLPKAMYLRGLIDLLLHGAGPPTPPPSIATEPRDPPPPRHAKPARPRKT